MRSLSLVAILIACEPAASQPAPPRRIAFDGNDHISRTDLLARMSPAGPLDRDVANLEELYWSRGYLDVKIDATDGTPVRIRIREGDNLHDQPPPAMGPRPPWIVLDGTAQLKSRVVLFEMASFNNVVHPDDGTLDRDLLRLAELYKNHGYLDIKIDAPSIEPGDPIPKIHIGVHEGVRFQLGQLVVATRIPRCRRSEAICGSCSGSRRATGSIVRS